MSYYSLLTKSHKKETHELYFSVISISILLFAIYLFSQHNCCLLDYTWCKDYLPISRTFHGKIIVISKFGFLPGCQPDAWYGLLYIFTHNKGEKRIHTFPKGYELVLSIALFVPLTFKPPTSTSSMIHKFHNQFLEIIFL